MPCFYFDYRDGDGRLERDEDGIDFPSLEAAYLDAHLAIIDIWAEARREGRDPRPASFEIRDAHSRGVIELPFAEALRLPVARR